MERWNGFLETKVSDKDAFSLPICLICTQNIYKKLGHDTHQGTPDEPAYLTNPRVGT